MVTTIRLRFAREIRRTATVAIDKCIGVLGRFYLNARQSLVAPG